MSRVTVVVRETRRFSRIGNLYQRVFQIQIGGIWYLTLAPHRSLRDMSFGALSVLIV
jgi:hypothetical protein